MGGSVKTTHCSICGKYLGYGSLGNTCSDECKEKFNIEHPKPIKPPGGSNGN